MRTFLFLIVCGGSLLLPTSLLAHGVTAEQINQLSALIQREPQNPQLYLRRGELYRRSGNARAALEDYDRVEKLAPQLTEVNFLRARLYFDAKAPEMTEMLLTRFLQQQPQHAEAWLLRAQAQAKLGAKKLAIDDYTQAITLLSRPKPEHYLARAELQLADKQPVAALTGLEQGVVKLGTLVVLQQRALEIEVQLKRWDAALARLATLQAQTPRQEFWLGRRGEILRQAGRKAEARQAFQAALTAIAQLPDHLRNTQAIRQLQARCNKQVS